MVPSELHHARRGRVDLSTFSNSWYRPGRPFLVRLAWMTTSRAFFETSFPWPYAVKRALLRAFGAEVGPGAVVKPRVRVKYPWNVSIGGHAWVGEGVWIDSLARVSVGDHACLSQGVMIETGNHDWSSSRFELRLGAVTIEEGAWAAVRSLLLPGARLSSHAVLGAGSTLTGSTEPYGVYAGVPATKTHDRVIGDH